MALTTEFNADAARVFVSGFINKSAAEVDAAFAAIGTLSPKSIDVLEDALVKDLKRETWYADIWDALAVRVEKKKDKPELITKMVSDFRSPGIKGIVTQKAAMYSQLAKLKPGLHPVLKSFSEDAAKLTDEDYAGVTKPLRLMTTVLKKINQPLPAAPPRKFLGQ